MSGDPEQEYFSDGISEDITTDLSKISSLGVVARNTAFTFKGQSVDVAELARKLGVSHVLEGSVRKAGGRVRINAQLIDGENGEHLWAERYDRDLEDIFAIQDEISKAIVSALKLKLLPEEKKAIEQRGTTCAEAYNLYLLARQYWATGNHGDPRREERVMRICSRAVEIDPYYAEAWALLAIAQSTFATPTDATSTTGSPPPTRHWRSTRPSPRPTCRWSSGFRKRISSRPPRRWRKPSGSGPILGSEQGGGALLSLPRDVPTATRHFEKAAEVMESDFHAWAMLVDLLPGVGGGKASQCGKPNGFRSSKRPFSRTRATARRSASSPAATPARDEERARNGSRARC